MRSRPCVSSLSVALLCALLASVAAAQSAGRQTLSGHVPEAIASSRILGRMPSDSRLNLAIGLPLRNQDELDALLTQLSDPSSPNYQAYLTPDQFAQRFGPAEEDYRKLIDFVQAAGLSVVGTHSNRTILDVGGSVAQIESLLHVNMMQYQHAARGRFFAPDREPSLDFDGTILSITGLDNFVVPRPMDLKAIPLSQGVPMVTGSGPAGLFNGKDYRAAYAPGVTLNGSGQTIGLFELDGFYSNDVALNFQYAGLPSVPVQTVLLDGFSGAPGGGNIEVTLDIMMAAYMAPGTSKIIVYEGTNWNDVLNRMATDNLASQLSCSWVFTPINATTEQIFKQYIAQGQSFFQASGDSGAHYGPIWAPADEPNVTVVGGTSLTTAGAGGPWQSETTWSGSGGGISATYTIPSYQQNVNMAANHGSTTMRNTPDVAMLADTQIFLIANNGSGYRIGGTSAAAPLYAGFMALANQQAGARGRKPVGFLNPLIYAIGNGANYQTDVHDITTGNNGGYSAISGYDLATGWGSPSGQHLIDDLTGGANQAGFTLSVSPASLSLKVGSSSPTTIKVTPANGFSGTVALAVSGLPSGVTGSFSPASTTGTSTLTLTASTSAAPGAATLTVTGTSGGLKSTTTISLTVLTPSFTLSTALSQMSIKQGASGATAVTVTPVNGFSGSVALTASGLPSGVTASFSPASTTGATTLTLAATTTAAPATASVTLTGASGTLKATATLSLTVAAAPNFSLSASPVNLSVLQGMSSASLITVAPLNGFTGTVAFTASGLPAGVTAAFSSVAADVITVTLTATATAKTGTSSVTITGASSGISHTAALALTVSAPSANTAMVNPSASYNVSGIVTDGSVFTGGGLDGGGRSYSGNLLGSSLTAAGTSFYIGPPNAPDAITSKTISLPAGQYSALKLVATAVNGNQPGQKFTVTYTDGTTSAFTQSLSDWYTPQNYPGESTGAIMNYRDNSDGTRDGRPFSLYTYSFSLTATKTVSSVTLPSNRNVVVLGLSLITTTPATNTTKH